MSKSDVCVAQHESHRTSEYHNVGGVEQKTETVSSTQTTGAESGAVVPVLKVTQRKQVSPRFITPVQGKIVDQGADVTLECILEGECWVVWAGESEEREKNLLSLKFIIVQISQIREKMLVGQSSVMFFTFLL